MEAPGQPKPAAAGGTESTERLKISPLARSLAKEMGIDYLKRVYRRNRSWRKNCKRGYTDLCRNHKSQLIRQLL